MKKRFLAASALTIAVAASAGWMSVRAYGAPLAQPAAGLYQDRAWDEPPGEFREVQKRGFHEGVEAARSDFEHHRRKDADDHDSYRHPHVERDLRDDFRDGFKRGYEAAMHHLREEHHDRDHD